MDEYLEMIHIVDKKNDTECWVTSDGQAHYDLKTAALRQLNLLEAKNLKGLNIINHQPKVNNGL